jgi:FkbM family methyltransferase
MQKNNFFDLIDGLKSSKPFGIMQVGASYGQEIELFKKNRISNCIMIEPLPDPFNYISNICKSTPGYIAVNALCSDIVNENVQFHVASNGGQSSSMLKPKDHLKIFDYVKFEEVINLTTTSVDSIYEFMLKNELYSETISKIDTLYLDVQGAEFKVLLGSIRFLKKINYIYFELIRGGLYENMTDLIDYISFLKTQGFVINNINFNEFHHSDVLFVKKELINL